MRLVIIPPAFIDRVWKDGAHQLAAACKWADREITPDQLKMLLSEGKRTLVALEEVEGSNQFCAWAAVSVNQLPNIRILYVYSIYAPGATGPECFRHLASYARDNGCSEIRGACSDSVLRLWERKLGAKKLYSIVSIEV